MKWQKRPEIPVIAGSISFSCDNKRCKRKPDRALEPERVSMAKTQLASRPASEKYCAGQCSRVESVSGHYTAHTCVAQRSDH